MHKSIVLAEVVPYSMFVSYAVAAHVKYTSIPSDFDLPAE